VVTIENSSAFYKLFSESKTLPAYGSGSISKVYVVDRNYIFSNSLYGSISENNNIYQLNKELEVNIHTS
jgi:hypothetical protein